MSRTISSTYASGITLTNTADNPVSVTGRISVASGAALTGKAGASYGWTIDNAGTIVSSAVSEGVFLGSFLGTVASGSLTNQASGRIASGGYGVFINGPGTVTNMAGGTIAGAAFKAVYVRGGPGTIVNGGVLQAGNVAAYEYNGGSITNLAGGTITGSGGVWFNAPGTFDNAGVVIGTNAGFGAVRFNSNAGQNRLIVRPGATFSGNINSLYGGNNVVELASAASAGVLAGFGTSITNFSSLQFDAGAAWTVSGSSLNNGLGTLAISGFTAGNTIDLTGFLAVSESFASNALVLTNAGSVTTTLHIEGSFTTNNFHLASDGNGGTYITEAPTPRTFTWVGQTGDWTTAAGWDLASVPTAIDTAVITQAGSNIVTIGSTESVAVATVNLNGASDTLAVDGTLATTGTMTVAAGTIALPHTGLLNGGTVADTTGAGLLATSGTFNAVTWQGVLTIGNNGGRLLITNGLTVTGTGGIGPGRIDLSDGGDAILNFVNSQTFDNATINLNGTDGFNPLTEIDIGGANNSVLTLGPGVTVNSTVANAQADIRNTNGQQQTSVVNQGTINAAAAGGFFGITPVLGFTNQGTITVSNGEYLSIQPGFGLFDNAAAGVVTVSGTSTLQIESSAVTAPINNAGTITMGSGSTLDLAGYFTVLSLGTLVNQGATTQIDGTFDGQSGTLTLGGGTTLGSVRLAGNIRNATLQQNGALDIIPGNASLLDDTVEGPLNVTRDFTRLTIYEGVQETDASGTQAGTINVAGASDTLTFTNLLAGNAAGQTLDNVTVNLGNATATDTLQASFTTGTFTIGSNATIASSTPGALARLAVSLGTKAVLNGTVAAAAKGGTFTIASSGGPGGPAAAVFNNNGLIEVTNGDTLHLGTAITTGSGTGTIDIASGGVADVTAGVASDQTVVFADTTGILALSLPNQFAAAIAGFGTGNTIDLTGLAATSAAWTAGITPGTGTLTVINGTATVASLSLLGDYGTTTFNVGSDGASGSIITTTPRPTAYAWIDGSADWATAADWDQSSVPWAQADVTIATPGSYSVTIGSKESVLVNSVALNNASATLQVRGALAVTGSIGVTAGTLDVLGSLSAGSIDVGGVLAFTGSNTLSAPLFLDSNGTLLAEDTDAQTPATLTLAADEIITQTGTSASIGSTSLGGEQIVNFGTIAVSTSGAALTIDPLGFTNAGLIAVGDGTSLTLAGAWSNTDGTIAANGTATIYLGGSFTTQGIGMFTGVTGVSLYGTLDNTDAILVMGTGFRLGTMTLTSGGTIVGGSIFDEGGGFIFSHGTFDGVTYDSATGLTVLGDLEVTDGLVVMGAEGQGAGTIDLSGEGVRRLDFVGSQTLDHATVHINGTGNTPVAALQSSGDGSVLTFGSSLLIDSTAIGAQGTIGSVGSTEVVNQGTILALATAGRFQISPLAGLFNQGLIEVGNGDTLELAGSGVTGAGTIAITSGGVADLLGPVASSQSIRFDDATGIVSLAQPAQVAATIVGFRIGDTIDLQGIAADAAIWTAGVGGDHGTLTISDAGSVVATLAISGDYSNVTFQTAMDGAGGTDVTAMITPCFAAGTRIATTRGAIPVERLREGDMVLTVSGGRQPIAWIGHRQVDCRRHPLPTRVWPIRIAPHAFGEGRPKRALLLSPDHAVFVENVLIPIKFLINDTTVTQVEVDSVTYYHVELPRHDVLLADGLPTESYLETGGRSAFANSGLPVQLHPDFEPDPVRVAMVWQNFGYAPLIGDAATVEQARAKLRLQALLLAGQATKPARMPRRAVQTG